MAKIISRKVLFIAAHRPNRSPSQRFRFEQYFDFFQRNGWEVKFSFLLDEKSDASIYQSGKLIQKAFIFLKSILIRLNDLKMSSNFDIIFVQREAFMTGSIYFEKAFAKRTNLIFDFDDSIWLHDINPAQGLLNKLKDASKTGRIIQESHLIFAGNQYLANYASQFNHNVHIVPTTIDTEEYQKKEVPDKGEAICIGWSGSFSTIKHFETVIPVLKEIKEKYQQQVCFKVIGDGNYKHEDLEIIGLGWSKETEIEDLSEIDIGLMPLPDDEWSKGKCGLKGLQYMALEIPTIMSPVGVNTEIIEEGVNGFLATTNNEWVDKISVLIDSEEIRKRIGINGRVTVVDKFSVDANKSLYLKLFNKIIEAP